MPLSPGADEQWRAPEPGDGRDPGTGVSGDHGTRIGATIHGRDAAAAGGAFAGSTVRELRRAVNDA